jgi:diguanylate cyclase (GGDEF)-like protein/putative nucleotidyltransferase with HDIG domain
MRLERTVEAERRNATTDALTGLVNHRGALQLLQAACESSTSDGRPLSLIMVDVDGFKLFNDTYGHITGDAILKAVAEVLRLCTSGRGTACRYGGDEFLLILTPCEKHDAAAVANAITDRLARTEFRTDQGGVIPIAASLGVATFPDDTRSPADLVSHADAAMYAAKKSTRPSGSAIVSITDHTTFGVLDSLVQAIDAKDRYTRAHCDIVADYAVKLAARMGLPTESQRALRVAGLLHDVGKLVVPDEILKKPAPLTPEEYEILKRHVTVGEVLIREVPQLTEVIQAVACHHERFDGTGYPRGMRGEAIPLIGRVIAVADSYSAMRLDRPYRKGMGQDRVLSELVAGAATQFDPDIAKVFVELLLEEDVLGRRAAA